MISLTVVAIVIGFALAIMVHESAHAYVADYLGDPTARLEGRISLNPLRHIDPIGSILVPGFLLLSQTGIIFGWAKPVPVNPFNFRNPTRDRLLVALAGPISNFLLGTFFAVTSRFLPTGSNFPMLFLYIAQVNFMLMMFNLIPIPPLDGSAVLPVLFKNSATLLYNMEKHGFIYLVGLLLLDSVTNGAILNFVVRVPVELFIRVFSGA
jgi:Zn-dependent protease